MKVVQAEIVRARRPIQLPSPWRPAWTAPEPVAISSFDVAFYRLTSDDGLTGIGPFTGADPSLAADKAALDVEAFWDRHMSARRMNTSGKGAAGLEVALWDLLGKKAGLPIHRMLGKQVSRLPAYAATTSLLPADEQVAQALSLRDMGFRAIKLRMHRPTPQEDIAVVRAVCEALGPDIRVLVDANQNCAGGDYRTWGRRDALRVARQLEEIGVYAFEEPLPRHDVEGWAEIARSVDMYVAGGESAPTLFDLGEGLRAGAFDVVQPDVIMGGNFGISGLRKAAVLAEHHGRIIMPHVSGRAGTGIALAATLQAMATVANCDMVEYVLDPPAMTVKVQQPMLRDPIVIDEEGCLPVPTGPGLGIELDPDWMAEYC